MKKFIVYGFKGAVWGAWEITTTPEMVEKRANERGIIVAAFEIA